MLLFRPIHALFHSLFLQCGQVVALFFQTLAELGSLPRHLPSTFRFMLQFGLYTLPLATLIGFFVGMVTALQTGMELKKLGLADLMVGQLVGISLMREMAPVITAVIITGRVGAAMTAEIGTMVVTEEVDVLRSLGIHPVGFLVVPRFVAAMLMVPALTIYSIFAGIWGGAMVATNYIGVSSAVYYDKLFHAIKRIDIESGMSKTVVFAAIISIVCCYCGLRTTRGAEGVGQSTRSAVVVSLSAILIADYFMTRFVGIA